MPPVARVGAYNYGSGADYTTKSPYGVLANIHNPAQGSGDQAMAFPSIKSRQGIPSGSGPRMPNSKVSGYQPSFNTNNHYASPPTNSYSKANSYGAPPMRAKLSGGVQGMGGIGANIMGPPSHLPKLG